MLSSSVLSQIDGDRLLITFPSTSLLKWWLVLVLTLIAVGAVLGERHSIRKLNAKHPGSISERDAGRGAKLAPIVFGGFFLLFWAFSYTSGSLTFDKANNTATIHSKMTAFMPARSQTVSLSDIDQATLDAKPNSRRIRLEMKRGCSDGTTYRKIPL